MILFVDACVRKESRTRRLAEHLLCHLQEPAEIVKLREAALFPVDEAMIALRSKAAKAGDFGDPVFDLPRQFRRADTLVIAAPYWDLSFPAILKQYLEDVCVSGLTFFYNDENRPQSLCRLRRVYYVTTAGGPIFNHDYGCGYVQTLTELFFGATAFTCFHAEHLDELGMDAESILREAEKRIDVSFGN